MVNPGNFSVFTITTFAQEKEKMVDKKSDKKEMRKTNRSQRATAMRDMTPETTGRFTN